MSAASTAELGSVAVYTTHNRGSTPEELATRALDKIIYVGSTAPPEIREQALVYRQSLHAVLVLYMGEAMRARDTTVAHRLTEAGHPELTALLRD